MRPSATAPSAVASFEGALTGRSPWHLGTGRRGRANAHDKYRTTTRLQRASAWRAQPLGNLWDARLNVSAQASTQTSQWMLQLHRGANRGPAPSSACLL